MLGKRAPEGERLAADHPYFDYVGRDSFYGFLAAQRDRLFRDEDFAALYCADNGRPSVPPEPAGDRAAAPDARWRVR